MISGVGGLPRISYSQLQAMLLGVFVLLEDRLFLSPWSEFGFTVRINLITLRWIRNTPNALPNA